MADNYKILNQQPDVELASTGIGFQNVWKVSYQVTDGPSKGTVGSVIVPDADHNASYVKTAIETKIASLDAIASL
jgi:hypothetical protein